MSEMTKGERLSQFKAAANHDMETAAKYFKAMVVRSTFAGAVADVAASFKGTTMQTTQDLTTMIARIPDKNVVAVIKNEAAADGIELAIR